MRRRDKEITGKREIRAIIDSALVCRLAMIDGRKPYLVPLCFGRVKDTLYFHSATIGRKLSILKKRPLVCFELETGVELVPSDLACNIGMKYKSVIGWGKAGLVTDAKEKTKGLSAIVRHYSDADCAFPAKILDKTAVFKVEIKELTAKKSG